MKLVTLLTALALDAFKGTCKGLWRRILGSGLVLVGIGVQVLGPGGLGLGTGSATSGGLFFELFCIGGVLATGAGYVLQARLSAVESATPAGVTATQAAAANAVVCQVVGACIA